MSAVNIPNDDTDSMINFINMHTDLCIKPFNTLNRDSNYVDKIQNPDANGNCYLVTQPLQILNAPNGKTYFNSNNISIDSINHIKSKGKTSLHVAILHQNEDAVRFLINNYVNNNTQSDGFTPLSIACKTGNINIIEMVKGSSVNIYNKDMTTALYVASESGNIEVVKLLLNSGADVNKYYYINKSPLFVACEKRFTDIINLLIPITKINDHAYGGTILYYMCKYNMIDIVTILIKNGVNTNPHFETTPLHIACMYGFYDIVALLIENGATINTYDTQGYSPMYYARINGHIMILDMLVKNGAHTEYEKPVSIFELFNDECC
jgi:uncharacterized protein